ASADHLSKKPKKFMDAIVKYPFKYLPIKNRVIQPPALTPYEITTNFPLAKTHETDKQSISETIQRIMSDSSLWSVLIFDGKDLIVKEINPKLERIAREVDDLGQIDPRKITLPPGLARRDLNGNGVIEKDEVAGLKYWRKFFEGMDCDSNEQVSGAELAWFKSGIGCPGTVLREGKRLRYPLVSASTAKSYVGFLMGHAICEGHIKNLDEKVSNYLSYLKREGKESVFNKGQTFRDMINMRAGHPYIWATYKTPEQFASNIKFGYMRRIGRYSLTVKKAIKMTDGLRVGVKKYQYDNILTDIVANAIDQSVGNEGMRAFFKKYITEAAGTKHPVVYRTDKQGWTIGMGMLWAHPMDYLRIAIMISKSWKSKSCIGDYLRHVYKEAPQLPSNAPMTRPVANRYGAFWWVDNSQIKKAGFASIEQRGHGGKRVTINLDTGAILVLLAGRRDFDPKLIFSYFNKINRL
ncbi:MAG: serine hydrolase domain-containing protein, partial [Pseudomonadota bacterium]|nr:serine hydrolase domain-containing protein [Pseudomonadota bacterium]